MAARYGCQIWLQPQALGRCGCIVFAGHGLMHTHTRYTADCRLTGGEDGVRVISCDAHPPHASAGIQHAHGCVGQFLAPGSSPYIPLAIDGF